MKELILWEIKDRIGYIIFNDPPSNRMTVAFFNRLNKIVRKKIKKEKVDAVIVYGNGRHFSSGADLKDLLSVISKKSIKITNNIILTPKFIKMNNKTFLILSNLKIPVIAAIQGVCLGSAMELILVCHARVCSENSLFGFPETTFNLMPGLGGTCRILDHVKYPKALELILKGETFDAKEALKLSIVDKIVNKHKLLDEAHLIAKNMIKLYKKGT